jgi:ring-1,2-phenylacetyl-CoA epoxidase subunit PaaD
MVSARETAGSVRDPELPMLTIEDLGILRAVREDGDTVTVTITPTYSGCPAMREIAADLHLRLERAGYRHIEISTQLSPPWTTAWITAEGRRKLAAAGIAPPAGSVPSGPVPLTLTRTPVASVSCPRCGSADTRETARFSGTACKALYQCRACLEPFEYVKEF